MSKRITTVLALSAILGFISIPAAQAVLITDSFTRADGGVPANSIGQAEVPAGTYSWSEGQLVFDSLLDGAAISAGKLVMNAKDRQVTLDVSSADIAITTDVTFVLGAGVFPETNATIFARKGGLGSGAFVWGEDGKVAVQFAPSGLITVTENNGGFNAIYNLNPWTGSTSFNYGAAGSLPLLVNGLPFDTDQDGRIGAAGTLETINLGMTVSGNTVDILINGLSITGPLALTFAGGSIGTNNISLATNDNGAGATVTTNFDNVNISNGVIPEPTGLTLLATGLIGLLAGTRRKRK